MSTPVRLAKQAAKTALNTTLAGRLGSVTRVQTTRGDVVLTFDDGPHPSDTPAILDVLARHDARVVFFVLLTRTRRHPELIARLLAEGHEVGLHGADHRRLTGRRPSDVLRELTAAASELAEVTGRPVTWFRPPHGAQSPLTQLAARRAGLTTVLWSDTIWDWKDVPDEARVAKALQAVPGSIILAHDGRADADDLATEISTVELDKAALTDRVLDGLAARGLRSITLTDALAAGTADLRVSFSR